MRQLNILILCEESQAECTAFRELGQRAFSCDLQPTTKHPEWHVTGDAHQFFQPLPHTFQTQDGQLHTVKRWHLVIAHPPCTYLCRLSACQLRVHGKMNWQRLRGMILGRRFFMECIDKSPSDYVLIENPVPMRRAQLPRPSFYACPSWYGSKYTKKTCYWAKNLPPLMPTIISPNAKCFTTASRGKYRSRTNPLLTKAIAEQYTQYLLHEHTDELDTMSDYEA